MNILVADDELFARKAVVQAIRDWGHAKQVYEAENGREALETLQANRMHMVFSDIRMPYLSGLELAAVISKQYPHITQVIISGYDDFSYAQQAIRYNVENYLLKPVDHAQLFETLERCKTKIALSDEKRQEEIVQACFYHRVPPKEAEGLFSDSYIVVVLRTSPLAREMVVQETRRMLAENGFRRIVFPDKTNAHSIVAWIAPNGASPADWTPSLHARLEEWFRSFRLSTGHRIFAGTSDLHSGAGALAVAHREAKQAVMCGLICGDDRVFHADDAWKLGVYRNGWIESWGSILYNKMAKGRTREAENMIRSLPEIVRKDSFSVYMLHDFLGKITAVMNALIEQSADEEEPAQAYLEWPDLNEYVSLEQLTDDLIRSVRTVASRLGRGRTNVNVIEDMKRYVERHYQEDISLEELAKTRYFVDPTYLSRLFKRKSGIRFSHYLASVRMRKAKELLTQNPDLTVMEVAGAVGFNDCSHFIQLYKKFYGTTPGKAKTSAH